MVVVLYIFDVFSKTLCISIPHNISITAVSREFATSGADRMRRVARSSPSRRRHTGLQGYVATILLVLLTHSIRVLFTVRVSFLADRACIVGRLIGMRFIVCDCCEINTTPAIFFGSVIELVCVVKACPHFVAENSDSRTFLLYSRFALLVMPKIHYTRFPVASP